ncbi:MAG: glycoside hydrolase family 5 protein [Pseudomonadota bacterium]
MRDIAQQVFQPNSARSAWLLLPLLLVVACDPGDRVSVDAPGAGGHTAVDSRPTGCDVATRPPTAPGSYYVNGNTVCTADGQAQLFHGVNRPSLEYARAGDHLTARDFLLMASWGANVVRMGLNQDFWLEGSSQFDPNYASVVDRAVSWAEAAGMDVILDLHWSDAGVLGSCTSTNCQQKMADDNSIPFWSQVAARYRDDGRVLFELYNEPHDVSWAVWKAGGVISDGYHAVGMQQLYETVRAAGANNLVLIGGLDWAYDLSGVPANRITGYNIAYATHPYNTAQRQPATWDRSWGFLTATDPVIATEFGNLKDPSCSTDYTSAVIQYADVHQAGWTAWGWYPGGCTYPALIDDWSGTPSSSLGVLIQTALLGYGGPHPSVGPEAPVPLSYTFDSSAELWSLNDYQDPNYTNLAEKTPPGATPATLTFDGSEGDPTAGSLELRVTISATDQYLIAEAQVADDLKGKTLHARVRLESGMLNGASVSLYGCAGTKFLCSQGPAINLDSVAPAQWTSLAWDLGTVLDPDFDTTQVTSVGVLVDATTSVDGTPRTGSLPSNGEATLQIDTVTE